VLLSVELCSLTIQRNDSSVPNFVVSGLFGDGAAALVAVGTGRAAAHPGAGPTVVATRSRLYPETERMLGWDIVDSGFQIVLAADMPALVRRHLRADVESFLAEHGLTTAEVGSWICHPGGPKVLQAVADALSLPPGSLGASWRSLRESGNLSSASVLHILRDVTATARPEPGVPGLLIGLGPGFAAELVLVRW
jgi:alkylresorcinol/alkylpyrone synthase